MADKDIKVLSSNSTDDVLTFAKISEFNTMEEVDIADYLLVSGFRDDEELTRRIRISDIANYFKENINLNMQWFIPVLKNDDGKIHWEFHNIDDVGTRENAPGVEHPILPIDLAAVIGDASDEKSGLLNPVYKAKLDTLDNVTYDSDGTMTSADKIKLDNIEANANNYSLPIASASTLGGVKVDNATITIDNSGVIRSAAGAPEAYPITITVSDWNPLTNMCKIDLAVDTAKRNIVDVAATSLDEWCNCRVHAVHEDATGITFACQTIPTHNLNACVISMRLVYPS